MTQILNPSRRRFLQALGVGAAALPMVALPGFVQAASARPGGGNILILVELAGGNDGLNTVVPIRDDAYRALRPEIGLSARNTLNIDGDTGLHPSLRRLVAATATAKRMPATSSISAYPPSRPVTHLMSTAPSPRSKS